MFYGVLDKGWRSVAHVGKRLVNKRSYGVLLLYRSSLAPINPGNVHLLGISAAALGVQEVKGSSTHHLPKIVTLGILTGRSLRHSKYIVAFGHICG